MPRATMYAGRLLAVRGVAAAMLFIAVGVAGCTAAPDADGDEASVDSESDQANPRAEGLATGSADPIQAACSDPAVSCTFRGQGEGCWDVGVVFYQDLNLINAHLPDGFLAEPALDTYARAGTSGTGLTYPGPIAEVDPNQGAVSLLTHECTSASPDMGAMQEAWVWIFIQPPAAGEGLPKASLDIYEWGHAGGSAETLQRKAALGWDIFGDEVETDRLEWSGETMQLDGHGQVFYNGTAIASVSVRGASDTPILLKDTLRVWHESNAGVARIDFDLGSQGARNYLSSDFGCRIEGTPLADLTGYRTCADAMADTSHPPPTGLINPNHGHTMSFHYTTRGSA